MKAFQIETHAQPAKVREIANPTPTEGQVLIRIGACGINFADLLMAEGTYQDTPTPPFTLGMEVCGIIEEVGEGVTHPQVGDRVAVFGGQGGLAELGLFAAERCVVVPEALSTEAAAGFMVAYGTSHLALTHRARLQPGERVLVFGAAGGVGLTAVEVAKALGAEVIAVARGADKCNVAKKAGADHVIDSTDGDLLEALRPLGKVDVVYDPVGGDAFAAGLKMAARQARIIVIGFASGDLPTIPANVVLVKNVDVIGFYWGGYLAFAPEILDRSLTELFDLAARGVLKPHVSHVLPLEEAGEALRLLKERRSTGKVVVRVSPEPGHTPD